VTAATPRTALERLTPRQREIMALVAKGLTNEEIGGVLGIAATTVKTHVTALMVVLEVTNRTEATAVLMALEARADQIDTILARPAIAVLPLVDLEAEPRTAALAKALSYDLSGLFAASCWFPVIAQVSANAGRSLGTTCQQIGAALGARFLVDGALCRRGSTWRLSLHIDDTHSGERLWSARNDFEADALFEVQDDVSTAMVAAAYPVLVQRLRTGARTHDLTAWELAHEGMALCHRREPALTLQARTRFAQALEREPTLVLAHFGNGLAGFDEALNQWGTVEEARERLLEAAERCIALAPHMGDGYFLKARYCMTMGDQARAVPSLEQAIANNPSFAHAHAVLAQALQTTGRSDEALLHMRRALRLGPRAFVAGLALMHLIRHEYAEALEHAESAIAAAPRYTFARVVATTSAHLLGDRQRAADHAMRLAKDYPPFAPHEMLRSFGPDLEVVRKMGEALKLLLP